MPPASTEPPRHRAGETHKSSYSRGGCGGGSVEGHSLWGCPDPGPAPGPMKKATRRPTPGYPLPPDLQLTTALGRPTPGWAGSGCPPASKK